MNVYARMHYRQISFVLLSKHIGVINVETGESKKGQP